MKTAPGIRALLLAMLFVLIRSAASAQTLPSPWVTRDIGAPAVSGSATYASGRFTIKGAGSDIWGSSDQFRFVYQPVTGDLEILARVESITRTNNWAKAGVMIRESLAADSRHAMMVGTAANGYAFQRRPETSGQSVHTRLTATLPGWVRLVRAGDLFTAYQSTDGVNWRLVGSDTIPMGDTVYVGLAVTSHNASTATTAVIDSAKVTPKNPLPNSPPAVSITAPVSNAQYAMPASIAIAANATDPEGQMLSVDFYANQTLISRDTAAPYSATFNTSTAGTYSLTAVAHDADGGSTTSAAVTVRVGAANGAPTVSLNSPTNGATFVAPANITIGANASDPENQLSRVEFYSGTTLLGTDTSAPYSYSWTNVGAGTYSLSATAVDAAGLKTTSSAVTISVGSSTAVPAPWTAADIGSPALAGTTSYSSGRFTIDAAGADIWNTSDQFRFVYQPVTGDVQITARVDSQTVTNEWANSGVMIRTSLAANSAFAYSASTSSHGAYFRQRTANGASATSIASTLTGPPVWVRLVRRGSVVSSFASMDGTSWTQVGSVTLTFGATAYVGLAATSHDVTVRTRAVLSGVTVGSPANAPPSVALTSPASGASFSAPATISMAATASDPENQLARVEFLSGATVLGTDTTAPYTWTWSSVAAGTYSLTAKAYDTAGAVATSAAVTVSVGAVSTAPRLVVFTASADHATNVTSYLFEVFAANANPATATPVATSDLGKPTPATNNDISVDRSSFFTALAPGTYVTTVSAIGPGGRTRSAAVTFTR